MSQTFLQLTELRLINKKDYYPINILMDSRLTKAPVSLLTVDRVLSVYITDKVVFYPTCLMGNNRFTAHR